MVKLSLIIAFSLLSITVCKNFWEYPKSTEAMFKFLNSEIEDTIVYLKAIYNGLKIFNDIPTGACELKFEELEEFGKNLMIILV
jgi:hypothetical protein